MIHAAVALLLSRAPAAFETVVTDDQQTAAPQALRVVRAADVRRMGARSVADALDWDPNLHVTTGARGERIFTLRGFDQRQTQVLLDGFPLAIAYDGQLDLNMLPAGMVDRITTVGTTGGTASGPVGLAGTVAVSTRRPGMGPFLDGRLEVSPLGGVLAHVSHAQTLGLLGYSVFAGADTQPYVPLSAQYAPTPRQPDGARLNSDRRTWHLGGGSGLRLGAWSVTAQGLLLGGARGVAPSDVDQNARYWRFSDWRAASLSVRAAWSGLNTFASGALVLRTYDNLLDSYDDDTYATQRAPRAFHTWYHDITVGGRWSGGAHVDFGVWSVGVHVWLVAGLDRHQDNGGGPAVTRLWGSSAAAVTVGLARLMSAELGAQWDGEIPVDLPGERSAPLLGVGPYATLAVRPLSVVAFHVGAARRTRIPSLRERFSRSLGFTLPNPDLRAETVNHVEVRMAVHATPGVRLEAAVFDALVQDLITTVPLGGGVNQRQNVGAARLPGVELGGRASLGRHAGVFTTYTLLMPTVLSGPGPRELAYRPTHKVTLGALLTPHERVQALAQARVVGPQRYQNPNTLGWGTLSPYLVVDARAELHALPWLHVTLRGTNLLDANYQSEFGFPAPGREVWLGLRFGMESPPSWEHLQDLLPALSG